MDLSKVVMTLKGKVPPEIPPISGIFEMTKKECLKGGFAVVEADLAGNSEGTGHRHGEIGCLLGSSSHGTKSEIRQRDVRC